MEIDLLEDVITVSFLKEFNFSLKELCDMRDKLVNLNNIKKEIVKYYIGVDGEVPLVTHKNHLDRIADNMVSVTKLISSMQGPTYQTIGEFGSFSLN